MPVPYRSTGGEFEDDVADHARGDFHNREIGGFDSVEENITDGIVEGRSKLRHTSRQAVKESKGRQLQRQVRRPAALGGFGDQIFLLGDALLDVLVMRREHGEQGQRRRAYLHENRLVVDLVENLHRREDVNEEFVQQLLVVDSQMVQAAVAVEQVDQRVQTLDVEIDALVQNRLRT